MSSWLHQQIVELVPHKRMNEAKDILFTPDGLALCGWSGKTKKIEFRKLKNLLDLFAKIGTNERQTTTYLGVKDFFLKKLRYAPSNAARRSTL